MCQRAFWNSHDDHPHQGGATFYNYDGPGNVQWSAEGTHLRLRLLTSEQSSLEGMTFIHDYTSLGHLSFTTYPHGAAVSYAPNALGQPTRVGNFATAAT